MIDNQLAYPGVLLGFSKKYTLATDGCTVSGLGRCLGLGILATNQLLKDKDCFALWGGEKCIIDWAKLPLALPDRIKRCVRVRTYDNDAVLEIIKREGFCIVCVDYDGNERTVGDHFVVYVGNKKLEDPLGGKLRNTTYYSLAKGYVDLELIKEVEMTEEQKRILEFVGDKTEGDVREAFGALADQPNKDKQIQNLQASVLDLEKRLKDLTDRLTALESNIQADLDLITDWQSKYETAKKNLDTANKTNIELTKEKNDIKGRYEKAREEIRTLDKMTAWQHIKRGVGILRDQILKVLGKK